MKETTPSAMPPCFEKWCGRFDDVLSNQAQKKGFRHYLGGLLGESERKNLTQMSNNAVGVVYHQLHHFLTEAAWDAQKVNERKNASDAAMQSNKGKERIYVNNR